MKSILFVIALLWVAHPLAGQSRLSEKSNVLDCYDSLRAQGEKALAAKRYVEAAGWFSAAKECTNVSPDKKNLMDNAISEAEALEQKKRLENEERVRRAEIEALRISQEKLKEEKRLDSLRIVEVLQEKQRTEAEKRTALANSFASKAQELLRNGDRSAAFYLAAFALRFIDPGNSDALQALTEAFYYNDHPARLVDSLTRLPWSFNFIGHNYSVRCVAFSPDGAQVASASDDMTCVLWDATTGRQIHRLGIHRGGVWHLTFSKQGDRIGTASLDSTAIIWDAATGEDLMVLRKHTGGLRGIDFSPNGNLVATCADDSTVVLWSAKTGLWLQTLSGHNDKVWCVKFSPDGNLLASASGDSRIFLWETATGNRLNVLAGHGESVRCIAFSNDGSKLVSASEDNTIGVWDVATGREIRTLSGHFADVWSVDFFTNDSLIVSSSYDNTVRVWNIKTGAEIMNLQGHAGSVWSVDVSPGDAKIATGSFDTTVKIWDIASSSVNELTAYTRYAPVNCAAFSPTGEEFAIATSRDVEIRRFDSPTLLDYLPGHSAVVSAIAYSPGGKYIASASDAGELFIWANKDHQLVTSFEGYEKPGFSGVAFSPNEKEIATATFDGDVFVWNIETGEPVPLAGHDASVRAVAWSPLGGVIATAGDDRTARVWDARAREELLTLRGHGYPVRGVAFSPDGLKIATASDDNTAKIWDALTGDLLLTLQGHTASVRSITFNAGGSQIATASDDKTVKIWDSASGDLQLTLHGHGSNVLSVAFSPDGRQLISGSEDQTVKIWDIEPDTLLARAERHHPPTSLVASQIAAYRLGQGLETVPGGLDSLLLYANPSQVLAFARYYEEQAGSSDNLALVKHKYLQSINLYNALLRQSGRPEFRTTLDRLYSEIGYKHLLAGQPDSALFYLHQSNPADFTVRRYLAHSLLFSGRYVQAANFYLDLLLDDFKPDAIQIDIQSFYDRKLRHADMTKILRLLTFDQQPPDTKAQRSAQSQAKSLRELDAIDRLDEETIFLYQVLKLKYQQEQATTTKQKLELLQKALDLTKIWQNNYPRSKQAAKTLDYMLSLIGFSYLIYASETTDATERRQRLNAARAQFELMGTQREDWKLAGLANVSYSTAELLFSLGDNLQDAITYMQASVGYFEKLSRMYPDNLEYKSIHLPAALVMLSWYQIWNKDYAAAEATAREAIRSNPSNLYAHRNLGHTLALMGRWDQAIESYLMTGATMENYRVIKQELGNLSPPTLDILIEKLGAKAARWEDEMLADEQDYHALNLFAAKDFQQAVVEKTAQIDVLRRLAKDNEGYKPQLATALSQLAFYRLFNNQAALALPEAEESFKLCPACSDVQRYLAHVRLFNNKTKDARRVYFENALSEEYGHRFLELCRQDFDSMKSSKLDPGKIDEIQTILKDENHLFAEALKLEIPAAESKHYSQVSTALADTIAQASSQGDYKKAAAFCPDYIAALTKLHRLNPTLYQKTLSDAWGNYSYYALFSRQPKKAIIAARNALDLGAGNWVKTNLGHGFLYQGKFRQAKDIYAVIKDVYDPALPDYENLGAAILADFRELKSAGIWHKNVPKAAAFIFGKQKLSFAEERIFGEPGK